MMMIDIVEWNLWLLSNFLLTALGKREERLDSEKKVTADHITDISSKSDDNLSNTSSANLASFKAALLLTLVN